MDSTIDDIKKRIDIVEYIGSFVALKKSGRNYKANCPFHNEKTPSFMVSADRQIWRCFGACQEGGDVISFLMKWENLTFYEALKDLAQHAGVKLDNVGFEDRKWKQKEELLKINDLAAQYFNHILTKHKSGTAALKYAKDRGFNNKLLETFRMGYAPQSWDSLILFLTKKGFQKEAIAQAGLAIKKSPTRYYDRFRGRLMFAIINARQQVIGFSGRLITDQEQAKYVNTPETLLYHKRETLYGIHVAHDAIRKQKIAILVEGNMDIVTSFKNGIKNTVSINGASVTKEQLMLLKRFTKHVIFSLDADFAGTESTLRAIKDAEEMDFRIDVIQYDFGKDPDEALRKDPVAYKKLIKKPISIYDFIINTAIAKHDPKDVYDKSEIVEEILPFFQHISNPIIKAHYMKRLSLLLDIDERDIVSMLRKHEYKEKRKKSYVPPRKKEPSDRYQMLQTYVLSTILQDKDPLKLYRIAYEILERKDFSIPAYVEIFTAFKSYENRKKKFDVAEFTNPFPDPIQRVLDELFLYDSAVDLPKEDVENKEKKFRRTLLELKRYSLKDKIKKSLEKEGKEQEVKELTKELMMVEKALRVL